MIFKDLRLHHLPGGKLFERVGIRLVSTLEYLQVAAHKEKSVLRGIRRARMKRKTLVTFNESFLVYSLVRSVRDMDGHLAEVGVYEGSTAKMICEQKGSKQVHLFDTFEGLPQGATDKEKRLYPKPAYRCSLESVQKYLSEYDNVTFHKGYFPDSAADLDPELKFSFVHMDVDLYESTRACLEFFYPRMLPGGIMLSHDYSILTSVERAFTEFFADKRENIIELPTTQCMVVKL
jgi:O-methyltransferase